MVTTKVKKGEKEYVMFSVCAPTLTKQEEKCAFGVCLPLGFSLSRTPRFAGHYSNPKHTV